MGFFFSFSRFRIFFFVSFFSFSLLNATQEKYAGACLKEKKKRE